MREAAGPLVLYVEDEVLLQELAVTVLSETGFTVSSHLSGRAAMAALESADRPIRVLITDIELRGDPDGWEVARHARELFPHLPIIYVSGGSAHEWTSTGSRAASWWPSHTQSPNWLSRSPPQCLVRAEKRAALINEVLAAEPRVAHQPD
jgi:CheY-like chemotaxis protein